MTHKAHVSIKNVENLKYIKNFLNLNEVDMLNLKICFNSKIENYDETKNTHYVDDEGYLITYKFFEQEPVLNEELYFTYKLNNRGFRSQHFKELNKKDFNILIAGCSNTFGYGLPNEFTWPNLITNKLKNKFLNKNVEMFNISGPGHSIPLIIRNIICFLEFWILNYFIN